MSTTTPNKQLLTEVEKGAALKHTAAPKESAALTQAKVLSAVTKKPALKHVDAPATGPSEAIKAAFIAKEKDDQ